MMQDLYNTEEPRMLKLKMNTVSCLLTLLPLGPGAPTAPWAPAGPRVPGKPGAPAIPAEPCGIENQEVRKPHIQQVSVIMNVINVHETYRTTLVTGGTIRSGVSLMKAEGHKVFNMNNTGFIDSWYWFDNVWKSAWSESSVYSQQVQRNQQILGYQAHHGIPGVPQIHGLPEDQTLPVGGSNSAL